MLKIVVNNQNVDIDDSTSIPVRLLNPMFHNIGTHSFPFTLPNTKKNRSIFNYFTRLEQVGQPLSEFQCIILFNGLSFLMGSLVIRNSTIDKIECFYRGGSGNFYSDIKNQSMLDIDLGESEDFITTSALKSYLDNAPYNSYPDYKVAMFPVLNMNYSDETLYKSNWDNCPYYNYYIPGSGFDYGSVGSATMPFLYIPYILSRMLSTYGYVENENAFTKGELSSLVLYHSRNFVPFLTFLPYGNFVIDYPINKFIDGIQNTFGCRVFVNEQNRGVYIKLLKDIINDHEVISFSDNVISIKNIIQNPVSGHRLIFKNDNIILPDETFKTIEDWMTVKTAVLDYASLPSTGNVLDDIRYCQKEDRYFIYAYDPNTSTTYWQQFTQGLLLEYYEDGDNEFNLETELSTTLIYYGDDLKASPSYDKMIVPQVAHFGRFDGFSVDLPGRLQHFPRLIFNRGWQPDDLGTYYPMGSNNVYKQGFTKITEANIALRWDGDYGIYENFYKEWVTWKKNIAKPVEIVKQLSVKELSQINFSKKHRIGNNNFFLSSINITLKKNNISPASIEAFTA